MEELKPCPFCGGDAAIRKIKTGMHYDKRTESWRVECSKCGAHPGRYGYESIISIENNKEPTIIKDGRKEAIDTWNDRYENDITLNVDGIKFNNDLIIVPRTFTRKGE